MTPKPKKSWTMWAVICRETIVRIFYLRKEAKQFIESNNFYNDHFKIKKVIVTES